MRSIKQLFLMKNFNSEIILRRDKRGIKVVIILQRRCQFFFSFLVVLEPLEAEECVQRFSSAARPARTFPTSLAPSSSLSAALFVVESYVFFCILKSHLTNDQRCIAAKCTGTKRASNCCRIFTK